MKTKFLAMLLIVAVIMDVCAETWTDPDTGYTWTYRVYNDGVVIFNPGTYGYGACAISPEPTETITIPTRLDEKPVLSIGDAAFSGCKLTGIIFPENITYIGRYAFSNCSNLKSIVIPQAVTRLGDGAFANCSGLTNVTLDANLGVIGASAFRGCTGIKSVVIPVSCNFIGDDSFSQCNQLRKVIIGGNLKQIGMDAFLGCTSLKEVHISDVSSWCGIEFQNRYANPLSYAQNLFVGDELLLDLQVPDNVKRITNYAFCGCSSLESVSICGDNINLSNTTNIGMCAFSACSNLLCVSIGCGVTQIDDRAFSECPNLKSVQLPDSLLRVASSVFEGCDDSLFDYSSIPGLKLLDGWVVGGNCNSYGYLDLTGVRGIWPNAFRDNTRLTQVNIPVGVKYIGYNAFYSCKNLSSVMLPNGLEVIDSNCFLGCCKLKKITIPQGVKSIGDQAFSGCTELSNVVFYRDLGCIGVNAFSYNAITELTLPPNVTVAYRAFSNCEDLQNVFIPEGMFLPYNVFERNSVFKINEFRYKPTQTIVCDAYGIGEAYFAKKVDYGGFYGDLPVPSRIGHVFQGWKFNDTYVSSNTIVCALDDHVLVAQWAKNWYIVTFDADGGVGGMTNEQVFDSEIVAPKMTREGYSFTGWQPSLLETVPASNVTYTAQWKINQYDVAFDGNGGALGESALPRIVTSQDYGSTIVPPSASRAGCTFEGWTPVVDATVPARDVSYTAQWKVWDITVETADVKIKDLYPDDYRRITNIVIGAEIEILPSGFFDGCDSLESITFLSPETDIGDNDLRKVGRLFDVQPDGYWIVQGVLLGHKGECPGAIPDVDSISRVIGDALEGCIALTDLTFTAESVLTSVGTNAFKGCTELRALTLPPSLDEIGDEAFMGCSYLDNVIVPGSVKRVGARAFKNCTGFTGALIEYGVESLGDEAFYGDWRISEVDIPSSVTNIGVNAFGGDSSIIRVGLRGDVRKVSEIFSIYAILREATVKEGGGAIVDGLFEGCAELADVHFLGNSPELANDGRSIYSGTPETLTTYVATTSTGWDGTKGSHSLPQAWPLVGNRRSIAQWDLQTYLVLFDSNGGTLGVQSTYQYSERKFTLPPEPVQTGYKFAGWWTKPVGGLRVTGDTVFIEGVYRTLYAHWTKGRWVFLDPNGGMVENEFVTYIEQTEYGVLPTPVRTGYAFDGWSYNGKTVLATDELLTDEDHVLKADWRKNKYTGTFDANFGDGGGVYELEYDSAIVPPVVVREGYMFLGWSPEVAATVPASNVTYAAQWKLNEYRVSLFVGNGEEGSQLGVTHGAKVGDIALPTRDGYVFGGWYDKPEDGKLVDGDTLIVGDMSLYAKWNSIYTVVFDANGGQGVMPDQPFVYGEEQALSNIVFKVTDRRFAGWATEKDGIVEYDDGEVVSNLTETANGVVTLYAVWEVWTDAMQTLDDIFGGDGDVSLDDHGTIVVTLTNDVSGTVEISDYVGAVTIDLNGHDMVGDGGPAIRIVKGDGDGGATRLAIVDTSEGEKGQISGGGESAGIEVVEDAATGVKLDVEEGVGVFNGDGSEQELKPLLVGTGKVTVPKSWKTGQKVTWKATADKGSVFARWEGPLVDSLNLTKNERRNPSLAFAVPEGFETNQIKAVFIPLDDDGLYALGITQTEFDLKETVSGVCVTDDSQSYVTATASGLPTGLKFDAKKMAITGTPTKSGVYWVQIKAKNASGYQWAENVRVTVPGGGTEAKEPKLTRTAYYPLTVICANDGGTVSGTGVYAEGKKVSVKATPAKGYVFAGWHETANSEKGTVNGVDGADYRSASLNVTVPETRYVFALFATKEDDVDSLKVAVEDVTTEPDGTIGTIGTDGTRALDMGACVSSLSLPKLAVSGLPTGLKYDTKSLKISGKATKPGVYTVTVKATNAAVAKATDASTTTFKITVPNFECAALPMLKPETDAYGIVRSGVKFDDGLVDCTPADGWTVKVAGLPSGLKWNAKIGKIVGVPTAKAGSYTVTFTASKKGEAKQVATITLNVEALPDWVVGTFDGSEISSGAFGDRALPCGLVKMTVAANGKISGKVIDADGTWALSAAAFDSVEGPVSNVEELLFHATVIGKSGKMAITNEVEIAAEEVAARPESAPYLRGALTARSVTATCQGLEPGVEWCAWQNLWKTEPWKTDAKAFAKAKPVEIAPSVPPVLSVPFASGIITLKFAATGAVTASGKFVTGQNASGRDIAYSATCSSVLIPDGDGVRGAPALPDALDFRVFLYFVPKAGKFDGYSDEVPLVWDGADFSVK